jgi:hypothetical protein
MEAKDKNVTKQEESKKKMPYQPVEESIKINPNPAANENIEEDKKEESGDTNGTGTEITDGEDG